MAMHFYVVAKDDLANAVAALQATVAKHPDTIVDWAAPTQAGSLRRIREFDYVVVVINSHSFDIPPGHKAVLELYGRLEKAG
jgi:hypothetical protein